MVQIFAVKPDIVRFSIAFRLNSLIYPFIWKTNDKIKCAALINDIEDGGLNMLDI